MKPLMIRTMCAVAAAAITLSVGSAVAENATDWSRPYIGVMVGSGAGGAGIEGGGQPDIDLEDGALTGGVYAGVGLYDFDDNRGQGWLLSAEASFRLLHVDDRKDGGALGGPVTLDGSWVGDAMLQIGYGWERTRVYGGLGVGVTDLDLNGPGQTKDDVSVGLAIGVGAETVLYEDWSARLDLRAMSYGEEDRPFSGGKRDVGVGSSAATIGISRRF